jgi:hypothetical protein
MQDLFEVAVLLFRLYLALGIMWIGLGFMVMGKNGGSRAARWYFANSLRWCWWRFRRLARILAFWLVTALMFLVVRPVAYQVGRGIRWLLTRELGWLWPR